MRRRYAVSSSLALLTAGAALALPAPARADPAEATLPPEADLFLASAQELPEELLDALAEHSEIADMLTVSAARLRTDGGELAVLGAQPERLVEFGDADGSAGESVRNALEDGTLVPAAAEGSEEGPLEPGGQIQLEGKAPAALVVAESAESAIPGIDGFVSETRAAELGMPSGNAAVISAPGADAIALQEELTELLPEDSGVQVLPGAGEPEEADQGGEEPRWDGDGLHPDTIDAAIAAAESKLGRPYVWGGSGPDVFDCSGLVQWAYAQAGVVLPRVTHDQWLTGPQLDYDDARRGDLLFWRSDPDQPDYISHVALYLGDAAMIEAPRRGEVVRITEVRQGNLAGAVRISPT